MVQNIARAGKHLTVSTLPEFSTGALDALRAAEPASVASPLLVLQPHRWAGHVLDELAQAGMTSVLPGGGTVLTPAGQRVRAAALPVLKMYCVVALSSLKKMNGVRGKFGTQTGHAYLHSYWDAEVRFPRAAADYRSSPMAFKITLVVPDVPQLEALHAAYQPVCGVSLVCDAARTVFTEPTVTCLGLGPLSDALKGEDLRALNGLT